VSIFCTKTHALCGFCCSIEYVTEEFPDLMKKWEEKKEHYNMEIGEMHGNQKKDEEVDVWLTT
jgi:hypothetical protein